MPHKDPEARKAWADAYYAKNAEKIKKRANDWYHANKADPEFRARKAAYNAQWREENRDQWLAWRRANRKDRYENDPAFRTRDLADKAIQRSHTVPIINAIIDEAKKGGCPCGEKTLVAIDMHHVDPETKSFSIGRTRYQKLHRPEDIRDEVAKCIPLCANCHRRQQALERPRKAPFYGRELMVFIAKAVGCEVCGEMDRVCLSFHHRDPSTKSFGISHWGRKGVTRESLAAELAKCVCLCENCHRKVHAGLITL